MAATQFPAQRLRLGLLTVLTVALVAVSAVSYIVLGDDHSDIGIYHQYALDFFAPMAGAARHLPVEYPPLALLPFWLTLIPAHLDYGAAYVLAMAVLFLASCVALWRVTSRAVASAYVIYMLLAGPWTIFGRFDLVPALVVLAAVIAATRGRWRLAYGLLGVGVLLKLFPVFLLPIFVLDQRRRTPTAELARGLAIFGVVVVAGFAAAAVVDPAAWTSPFRYALERPVEIESLPATLLWVIAGFGSPGRLAHTYNSFGVIANDSAVISDVFVVALILGCLLVLRRQLNGDLSPGGACLALLCVVVVTNKVLSPQYLVWLLPLVAFEMGLDAVWVGVCLLTFLIYPILFGLTGLTDGPPATAYPPVLLFAIAVRNGLLVIATWRAVVRRSPAPSAVPAKA